MAYIDEETSIDDSEVIAMSTREDILAWAKVAVWGLFERHKNESYKGKLWGMIPYSVKVEKIEPILTRFLGPNPYA